MKPQRSIKAQRAVFGLSLALTRQPAIDRGILRYDLCSMRDGESGPVRWYAGPICPGDVYAWEPELPHARELCVVIRIADRDGAEPAIFTRALHSAGLRREIWNDESRFREAVVPTLMRPWKV